MIHAEAAARSRCSMLSISVQTDHRYHSHFGTFDMYLRLQTCPKGPLCSPGACENLELPAFRRTLICEVEVYDTCSSSNTQALDGCGSC
jgi:hypothetical protein